MDLTRALTRRHAPCCTAFLSTNQKGQVVQFRLSARGFSARAAIHCRSVPTPLDAPFVLSPRVLCNPGALAWAPWKLSTVCGWDCRARCNPARGRAATWLVTGWRMWLLVLTLTSSNGLLLVFASFSGPTGKVIPDVSCSCSSNVFFNSLQA